MTKRKLVSVGIENNKHRSEWGLQYNGSKFPSRFHVFQCFHKSGDVVLMRLNCRQELWFHIVQLDYLLFSVFEFEIPYVRS